MPTAKVAAALPPHAALPVSTGHLPCLPPGSALQLCWHRAGALHRVPASPHRSEAHTSELQSLRHLGCRLPRLRPPFPHTPLSLSPRGTCHVCRRDRPCNYAGTERAICIACQRRLTQRRCDQCGRVTTIERRVDRKSTR